MNKTYKVKVFQFHVGDVDVPEVYASTIVDKWQNGEAGKWIKEKTLRDLLLVSHIEPDTFSTKYNVIAELSEHDYTYYALKFL